MYCIVFPSEMDEKNTIITKLKLNSKRVKQNKRKSIEEKNANNMNE